MGSEPSEKKEEKKGFEWTPDSIKAVGEVLERLIDKYIVHKEKEAQADNKYLETVTKSNRNITIVLVAFLSFIVVGMAILTLCGKVSGDALLFLVGTITGYVIIFIQRLVFGAREKAPTPETE